MTTVVRTFVMVAVVCIATATQASAQGNSGSAPGQAKKGANAGAAAAAAATVSPATATAATSAPAVAPGNALYYGSWLDDASVMAPRTLWVGASTAYWKADAARQVDAPILMGAFGVAPRIQVGGSLPIYHFRDETGVSASGVGTVSLYGKVMLLDPGSKAHVGLAVAPLIEAAPGADAGFGWALPVNVEVRADRFRVYGSSGYFSRGSVFASAAVEIPTGGRTAVTWNLGQSHASGSHQTSVGMTLAFFPASTTGLFVSLSHSSAAANLNNGGTSIGGGFSFSLQPRVNHP
jgi:hypothetical protein